MSTRAARPQDHPRRRSVALGVAALLAVGPLALVATGQVEVTASPVCGPGGVVLEGVGGPPVCAHSDVPPPGVDVTEPVSTAELRDRDGASEAAVEAAEELGVATPAANATSPAVLCDGDGSSGYRVQGMYVVEAGRTNRFAALEQSLKLWAAGTDDVFNRSAALTGGVRNLRFVTEPGTDGGCEADILNVTVPAGSMASFGATINAVQALGHTRPDRKYLMWTDATVLCGVATMYTSSADGQGNPNNGSYAQYARVDSGCWGWGDGAGQHSVEAHEVLHTLGGVFSAAPHGTTNGHCWDESDTMCYADGGGHAMVQVCSPAQEYLLDCGSDDYYSTYPEPGSWLDTHWNAADSRFLIGGGDGTGGGSSGSPTVLGASLEVNNPAVPGLGTQATVTPSVPSGRTVTDVSWKAARTDCTFTRADATSLQATVTCGATATGSTTVTVTVTDSTGATKSVSSPLTFTTGTARPVSLALAVASQSTSPASVCTGAGFPVAATVTDTTTGQPVKGLSVTVTRQTSTMTAPSSAGAAVSTLDGVASVTSTATAATAYGARTAAGSVYAAGATSSTVTAVPGKCTLDLAGGASTDAIYYGETVTVSGTLTRQVDGRTIPVSGASLPVRLTYPSGTTTRALSLGTARTAADGSWSLVTKPTQSGALSVSVPASTAYEAVTTPVGDVVVHLPDTDLTASADRSDVGYGDPVVVTGRLTKTAGELTTGAVTSGVAGATVSVRVTAPGRSPVVVGSGRTAADGTYRISVPLKVSGTMTVTYAGAAGSPAASATVGDVVAGTWSTATTLGGSWSSSTLTLSGTVTKSYAGATVPGAGLRVRVVFTPTGSATSSLVTSPTTTTSGLFTARVTPTASGTYTAVLAPVTGYTGSSSPGFAVVVP